MKEQLDRIFHKDLDPATTARIASEHPANFSAAIQACRKAQLDKLTSPRQFSAPSPKTRFPAKFAASSSSSSSTRPPHPRTQHYRDPQRPAPASQPAAHSYRSARSVTSAPTQHRANSAGARRFGPVSISSDEVAQRIVDLGSSVEFRGWYDASHWLENGNARKRKKKMRSFNGHLRHTTRSLLCTPTLVIKHTWLPPKPYPILPLSPIVFLPVFFHSLSHLSLVIVPSPCP